MTHAEYQAILTEGTPSVRGCTLYVTKYPCNVCAKLIVQSGISKVVYDKDGKHTNDPIPAHLIVTESDRKCNSYVASKKILENCLQKQVIKSVIKML